MARLLTIRVLGTMLAAGAMAAPPAHGDALGAAGACDGSTHAYFNLTAPGGWVNACTQSFGNLVPGVLGQVEVQVFSVPFSKARFVLPDPPFGVVLDEVWNYPATGDRHTGIELDVGCSGGGAVLGVLTILVESGTVGPCAPWKVMDGAEIDDCAGNTRVSQAVDHTFSYPPYEFCGCCFQCCQTLPPYGLHPPDGAQAVPFEVELSWTGPPEAPDEYTECWIRIGTDPTCASGQTYAVPCDTKTFSPDFLAPETTYYWQAGWSIVSGSGCSSGSSGTSAVHAFTTTGPIAVEQSTWGRVKAMYRN